MQSPPNCGRQIHPSISSSLVLQGRLPTLQKGLLMPVWALLPSSILAWSPTQAPFVIYLSLLKNWKAATEFDSFLWLGCTLPRVSLKITKVSIIMWRLCIWEMGGLCHIQTISWLTNGKNENILLPSLGLYSPTPFSIYCTSELL